MNKEKIFTILLAPRVTEKTTGLAKDRQYVFKVRKDANKVEVAQAVKALFNVEVLAVRVCNVKGKKRRFGRFEGKHKDWKKAYVSLKEGQVIDLGVA